MAPGDESLLASRPVLGLDPIDAILTQAAYPAKLNSYQLHLFGTSLEPHCSIQS